MGVDECQLPIVRTPQEKVCKASFSFSSLNGAKGCEPPSKIFFLRIYNSQINYVKHYNQCLDSEKCDTLCIVLETVRQEIQVIFSGCRFVT